MQRQDERKRQEIITVATRLFATRAFHEVRLEDVAAAARIGKGTVYVYFRSKEDLFLTLIRDGVAQLVERLRGELQDPTLSAWGRLERIVTGHVEFATRFPHLFHLMRAGTLPAEDAELQRRRRELATLVERTIRRGTRDGELCDPHPELTAQFVLSSVRGALLYGKPVAPNTLRTHLLRVLAAGIHLAPGVPPFAAGKTPASSRSVARVAVRSRALSRRAAQARSSRGARA